MLPCIHTYIHTYIHKHTHIYIYIYIHYIDISTYTLLYKYILLYIRPFSGVFQKSILDRFVIFWRFFPSKWLQNRPQHPKPSPGIPPRRAFCGCGFPRSGVGHGERLVIYCQTTGVSAAHATHCATYCTPCRPLIRAFSGWIRTPPPTGPRRTPTPNPEPVFLNPSSTCTAGPRAANILY